MKIYQELINLTPTQGNLLKELEDVVGEAQITAAIALLSTPDSGEMFPAQLEPATKQNLATGLILLIKRRFPEYSDEFVARDNYISRISAAFCPPDHEALARIEQYTPGVLISSRRILQCNDLKVEA